MAQAGVIGVTIPNNAALSDEIDLGSSRFVALELPSTWSGTAITFQAKASREKGDGTKDNIEVWKDVYDDTGTEVSITVAANRVVVIGTVTKAALGAARFIRLRSGTTGAPVNQSPAKVVKVITKGE